MRSATIVDSHVHREGIETYQAGTVPRGVSSSSYGLGRHQIQGTRHHPPTLPVIMGWYVNPRTSGRATRGLGTARLTIFRLCVGRDWMTESQPTTHTQTAGYGHTLRLRPYSSGFSRIYSSSMIEVALRLAAGRLDVDAGRGVVLLLLLCSDVGLGSATKSPSSARSLLLAESDNISSPSWAGSGSAPSSGEPTASADAGEGASFCGL